MSSPSIFLLITRVLFVFVVATKWRQQQQQKRVSSLCVEFLFGSVRERAYCKLSVLEFISNWFGFLLTVQVPNPRICVNRVRVLWFGTNSIWMPSCMVLCFVHNAVRNPLEAIPTPRQHCDCVKRIDPNTGNVRLRSFRCSEHSLALPRCPETSLLDTF